MDRKIVTNHDLFFEPSAHKRSFCSKFKSLQKHLVKIRDYFEQKIWLNLWKGLYRNVRFRWCALWLDFYWGVVSWESHLGTTIQGQEDRDILDIPSVMRKRNSRQSFVFECYDEFSLETCQIEDFWSIIIYIRVIKIRSHQIDITAINRENWCFLVDVATVIIYYQRICANFLVFRGKF